MQIFRFESIHFTRLIALIISLSIISALFKPACADEKPEIFVQMGHSHWVESLAFSPDGKYVLSGGGDNTAKLWDTATGKEIRTVSFKDKVYEVAFSPDGQYAVSKSGNDAHLWEINSGRIIKIFQGKNINLAFSPSGKHLLSVIEYSKNMELWEVSSGMLLKTLTGHQNVVSSIAFSPNSKYAISGSSDKSVKLWDLSTGEPLRTFGQTNFVSSIAFSPDGRNVLSGDSEGTLKLWRVSTGAEVWKLQAHSGKIDSVTFSLDGGVATSSSYGARKFWQLSTRREAGINLDKDLRQIKPAYGGVYAYTVYGDKYKGIRLWEASTGREVGILKSVHHTNSFAFSPDGKSAVSGGEREILFWDVAAKKVVRTFQGYSQNVFSLDISPDGRHVIAGYYDKTAKLWDLSAGREASLLRMPEHVRSAAFSPDGRYAILGQVDAIHILDMSRKNETRPLTQKGSSPAVFSPDGLYVASGGYKYKYSENIRLYESSSGKETSTFKGNNSGCAYSIAFSPDGKYLLSGGSDETVKLWEVTTGSAIKTFQGQDSSIESVAFSPDGRYALSGGRSRVKVWDIATGQEISTYRGHSNRVKSVAFSPNGRYALSGGDDSTVQLWEISTGKHVKTFLQEYSAAVQSVKFSPDGRYVLSGNASGAIQVWHLETGNKICTMVGFADGEWVTMTPEGYFNASPNGAKYLNVRVGKNVYSIDNFYEIFFNPVYVASVLQGKKVDSLADIRKGIMTPPDIQIISPKPNETVNNDSLSVTVAAKDTGGGIDELRLYHNGKVVGNDTRAVKVVPKGQEATQTYIVTLLDGINTFRAVGFSKDRTESNPYELIVHLSAPQKEISMHVLAVGINKYRNPALNLNYAVPDAKGIADFFSEKGIGLFKKVDVTNVFDENATKSNITAKLKSLENTKPQDVVLIYLAGHGESISDKWYFIPHELAYPEREDEVKSKGISSDDLAGLIRNIKAQKVLVMIDSCKAGAMLIAMRGFEDRKALSQLSRSTGVHVIAASTKDQFAAEVKDLGHGVFTYTLLEGLKGLAAMGEKTVTVRKLMTHVENRLPDITMKYRRESQFPVVDSRGMDFPLVIVK